MDQETRIMEPVPAEDEIKITATPWLDEVSDARRGDSLEWPAPPSDRDIQHRERIDTPRVRHLFPVPDSDWEVSHLEFEYDRNAGRALVALLSSPWADKSAFQARPAAIATRSSPVAKR